MNNFNKQQKGFTLIEMIVSVFIVTTGIIGVFSLVSNFSEQSQSVRDGTVASYLAQEGIEIVKNIRDTNMIGGLTWDNGFSSCYDGCEVEYNNESLVPWTDDGRFFYLDGTTGFYKYIETPVAGDIKTYYKRRLTITPVAQDEMHLRIDIYYEGKSLTFFSKIYNWQ